MFTQMNSADCSRVLFMCVQVNRIPDYLSTSHRCNRNASITGNVSEVYIFSPFE